MLRKPFNYRTICETSQCSDGIRSQHAPETCMRACNSLREDPIEKSRLIIRWRITAYPQDPAAGLAEKFLQHRDRLGRHRFSRLSQQESSLADYFPRRRARECDTRVRDWFSAVVASTRPAPSSSSRGSMRTSRRHATKYRSGSPRRSIYYLGRSPGLRSRPRTIIPERGARGYQPHPTHGTISRGNAFLLWPARGN